MIHLVKLSVGVSSVEELESYRDQRAHWWGADYGEDVHVHRTRMTPRRAGELAGKSSIYWVIGGVIGCRQPILRFEQYVDDEGKSYCDIIMSRDLVRTVPYPKRPFQGWRYLQEKDAPPDLAGEGDGDGSPELAAELARLGLL
ncbi:hypothetical protein GCM10007989_03880 [Devosia pacifica]|uniref:DUF1489 domain-containing protein n=1 Tax=Devosia pacifica TaxID=1335967 RepID=A0A918RVL4_9HYPH|nr:DUF1489 domain-containing protein [Devosia pacifica]GHA12626.1 hypothetical protein GCM10007989_03880 [Devosia pacifica]